MEIFFQFYRRHNVNEYGRYIVMHNIQYDVPQGTCTCTLSRKFYVYGLWVTKTEQATNMLCHMPPKTVFKLKTFSKLALSVL